MAGSSTRISADFVSRMNADSIEISEDQRSRASVNQRAVPVGDGLSVLISGPVWTRLHITAGIVR
jgi:hypothetical protein